jgi:sterol desaturase/sphingolipid hydroxylase (fatty acid hydroxylase superfamily)
MSRQDTKQALDWLTPGLTLGQAARAFFAHLSPRLLAPALIAAIAARIALGGWSWRDAIIPAAILAAEPFTEWAIHVFILHFRPRTIGGRYVDPLIARKHRAHHLDPRDAPLVFVPPPILIGTIIGTVVIYAVAFRHARPALTATAASLAMLSAYEWTHFLIHSSYRPRRAAYRVIWRAHRLHHFRNEHYWFGVTMHLADRVLRTYPAKDAVPPSPTARTLGVDLSAI